MSFGLEHLAPLLPAFMEKHPAVLLDLHFNDALVNIVEQGFDMALRISTMDDSSLLVRRLCNLRLRLLVLVEEIAEQLKRAPGSPSIGEIVGFQPPRRGLSHRISSAVGSKVSTR